MRGEFFVDSNIWLYLFDADTKKKATALSLLREGHTISTQVLTENANVCLRKFKMSTEDPGLQHHSE